MRRSCIHHPDRPVGADPQAGEPACGDYCADCRAAQVRAVDAVGRGALPRECLVTCTGPGHWVPLRADLAAHWVAHACELHASGPAACLAGFAIREPELLRMLVEVEGTPPRPGDVFQALDRRAWGRVTEVKLGADEEPRIAIESLDTRSGRIVVGDFYRDFRGMGRLLRRP